MKNHPTPIAIPNRRNFIKYSSLGMLFLSLHPGTCFSAESTSESPSLKVPKGRNLIKNIRLLTTTPLGVMKDFYLKKIGLSIVTEQEKEVTFLAGGSTLTFIQKEKMEGQQPWYHFAFNIPENKILKARAWQTQRTELIQTPKRLRDAAYPNDIRHFRNWNAHSVFFYDPAGNLVEYIARHDLDNGQEGDFSSKDLLNISEIGFIVDEQPKMAATIHEKLNLPAYPKNTDFWWSMGNENGLILCLRKRVWAANTPYAKKFNVFETAATIRGKEDVVYAYEGFPYRIKMEKV